MRVDTPRSTLPTFQTADPIAVMWAIALAADRCRCWHCECEKGRIRAFRLEACMADQARKYLWDNLILDPTIPKGAVRVTRDGVAASKRGDRWAYRCAYSFGAVVIAIKRVLRGEVQGVVVGSRWTTEQLVHGRMTMRDFLDDEARCLHRILIRDTFCQWDDAVARAPQQVRALYWQCVRHHRDPKELPADAKLEIAGSPLLPEIPGAHGFWWEAKAKKESGDGRD